MKEFDFNSVTMLVLACLNEIVIEGFVIHAILRKDRRCNYSIVRIKTGISFSFVGKPNFL